MTKQIKIEIWMTEEEATEEILKIIEEAKEKILKLNDQIVIVGMVTSKTRL